MLASAGLITMATLVAEVRPPPLNWSPVVPAVSSARPVKVATPPDTVTVAPTSCAEPVLGEAVITVLLSSVEMLPY